MNLWRIAPEEILRSIDADALAMMSRDDLHLTSLVSRGWFRILFCVTSDRFDFVFGVQRLV